MDGNNELHIALNAYVKRHIKHDVFAAKVTSVNANDFTCEAVIDGLTLYDIRLRATDEVAINQYVLIPKLDSWIMVQTLGNNNDEFFVVMFSEIDKAIIHTDTHSIEIGNKVKIANNAETLGALLGELIDKVTTLTVTTPTGIFPITPALIAPLIAIKTRLNSILE
jgi:hypothetical protein